MKHYEPKFKIGDNVRFSRGPFSLGSAECDFLVIKCIDRINSWYTVIIKGDAHPYTFSMKIIDSRGKLVIDYNHIWQEVLNEAY